MGVFGRYYVGYSHFTKRVAYKYPAANNITVSMHKAIMAFAEIRRQT